MNNVISLPPSPVRPLVITLCFSDPEVLHELEKRDEGAAREAFALQALRLGVLSLRQANGALDADAKGSAPQWMDALHRVGVDIFVVWDAEDPTTDVTLKAAIGLARSLAHKAKATSAASEADFDALIEEIAAHVATLDAIEKAARSVKKNGEAILGHAETMREELGRQVEALREQMMAQGRAAPA